MRKRSEVNETTWRYFDEVCVGWRFKILAIVRQHLILDKLLNLAANFVFTPRPIPAISDKSSSKDRIHLRGHSDRAVQRKTQVFRPKGKYSQ